MEPRSSGLMFFFVALAIGAVVCLARPEYRSAFRAWWAGQPEQSMIWQSNANWYPALEEDSNE